MSTQTQNEFSPSQAATLQDLAWEEDVAGGHAFDHFDFHEHLNGLSGGFPELEDPIALLESLASFENTSANLETNLETNPPGPNDNFASLLQAVTATVEAEEQAAHTSNSTEETITALPPNGIVPRDLPSEFFKRSFVPEPQQPNHEDDERDQRVQDGSSSRKRRRKTTPQEESDEAARERELWGSESEKDSSPASEDGHSSIFVSPRPSIERPAGVASAAALFKRQAPTLNKPTRAPMSKLLTSLQLEPDAFMEIQAAAKKYMLDELHPERKTCVAEKKGADPELAKLRLFECTKAFLDDEGWGELIFGVNAKSALPGRALIWPQNQTKIITQVGPLLRRMVTNERQRLYAIETREKKAGAKKSNRDSAGPSGRGESRESPATGSPSPGLEPTFVHYHHTPKSSFNPEPADSNTTAQVTSKPLTYNSHANIESELRYHLNILRDGRRIRPKITLNAETCPKFSSLILCIHEVLNDDTLKLVSLEVLGPKSRVDIPDEEKWRAIVDEIKQVDWMDGDVKCVVNVEQKL